MSQNPKPYKGNKRDQYTIVLEQIHSDFRVFGEGLQQLNQKFDGLESRFDGLEHKVDNLSSKFVILDRKVDAIALDVVEIKHKLNRHDERFEEFDRRITTLEKNS